MDEEIGETHSAGNNNNDNNYNNNDINNIKKEKMNPIIKIIVNHYKNKPQKKSEKQIENEKYLFGKKVKFNRWILFPVALLSQFTVGSLYAWSIYNKPVDGAIYGDENKGMAPYTFYVTFFFFGSTCSILGPILDRIGPMRSMYIGSTLFAAGHFLTALGIYTKVIWLVYIGYGALGGAGMGICYIGPVSTLQKWFPDHRGLAAGLAVCGFGAGSIAFGSIPIKIIARVGLALNFVVLGSLFLGILYLVSFVFRTPPPNFQVDGKDSDQNKIIETSSSEDEFNCTGKNQLSTENKNEEITSPTTNEQISASSSSSSISPSIKNQEQEQIEQSTSQDSIANNKNKKEPKFSDYLLSDAITSSEYTIIYLMFFCNIIFGVVAIGRLSDMCQNMYGKSKVVGAMVVSVNGAFNLFGRLIFGFISDKIGRKKCYIAMLTIQCFSVGFLIKAMKDLNYEAFIALIWISTLCYGGSFGVIPAFLNDMFGSKNVGATHGLILSAWALAGVGGGITFSLIYNDLINNHGYGHHSAYPYLVNYYWIVGFICVGWVLVWFIRTTVPEVFLPPIKGQILRVKLLNHFLRISTSKGFELLSNQQLKQEWNDYLNSN
ncbi:hypothetical protein RB653_010574 [Dictyostelium firmibasis]|uniref:Major facilitator superfamily (MFS) profile domain-containing protein n=1 Tax=Dictyostelium firmibasis TaxID=79012 RepID=A0AAN7YQ05_9MYCE